MTIQGFAHKFKEIKALGYIPTMRKGPIGIGYTLEPLLEISENNSALPDVEGTELKAHRTNVNGLDNAFYFQQQSLENAPVRCC